MNRTQMIQHLARSIGATRYLEIGVQHGINFRALADTFPHRVGVDPDRSTAATIHQTSDRYFADLDPAVRFDVIFIDGLHHADQVERDADNALRHLSPGGVVVLHDCDPPTEKAGRREMCSGIWCGDVWRAWLSLRVRLPAELYCVDTDLGCGVIVPDGEPNPPDRPLPATWSEFRADRAYWLNLLSVPDFAARWPAPVDG